MTARHFAVAIVLLCLAAPVQARVDSRSAGWDQHPGVQIPLQLRFRDESNRLITLGDYFGRTPVVLVLTYFSCPELCPMVLQGVEETLHGTGLQAGRDFQVLAVSIDPHDTPAQAQQKKTGMLKSQRLQQAAHFLTSPDRSAAILAHTLGFRYAYDAEHGQFAHAAGFIIVNPRGEVSQYVFGVRYPTDAVRAALVNAGRGRIATYANQLLLLCYHFDPTLGRYDFALLTLMRGLGILAVLLGLAGWWYLSHSRSRS